MGSSATAVLPPPAGPATWPAAYRAMARWQLASLRLFLPLIVVVQVLIGAGIVLGFGLFLPPPISTRTAEYLCAGVPVFNLYMLGLILLPQTVGQHRIAGTYDYMQSVPIPRTVTLASWWTVALVGGVPGVLAALVAARLRFGFHPHPSPDVVAAVLLVSLTATAMGAANAHAVRQPMIAMIGTQILNFIPIGFAPVALPADQLPHWLVSVNRVLPFESMGVVMRAGLSASPVDGVARGYLMLALWSAGCLAVALWAMGRRA